MELDYENLLGLLEKEFEAGKDFGDYRVRANEWLQNEWLQNEWLQNEWLQNEWLQNEWLQQALQSTKPHSNEPY